MPRLRPDTSGKRRMKWIAAVAATALILAVGFTYFRAPLVSQPEDMSRDLVDEPSAANTDVPKTRTIPETTRTAPEQTTRAIPESGEETGEASWYDFSGNETASGKIMDADGLTAAHRSLPFGTRLRVENLKNGRTVVVRVNDRGPYTDGRLIDLSKKAAERLGMIADGVAKVRIAPAAP